MACFLDSSDLCSSLRQYQNRSTPNAALKKTKTFDPNGTQAIAPDRHPVLLTPLGCQIQVGDAVPFVKKGLLTPIAALRDMVWLCLE